jgi:hypothetical protein
MIWLATLRPWWRFNGGGLAPLDLQRVIDVEEVAGQALSGEKETGRADDRSVELLMANGDRDPVRAFSIGISHSADVAQIGDDAMLDGGGDLVSGWKNNCRAPSPMSRKRVCLRRTGFAK